MSTATIETIGFYVLAFVISYVLGSILFAQIVAKIYKKDIFEMGTGMPGTSNIFFNIGPAEGVLVWGLDCAKGIIAVAIALYLFELENVELLIPTVGVIIGHWRSIFAKFKGGDGIVALVGALLVVLQSYFLIALAVSVIIIVLSKKYKQRTAIGMLCGVSITIIFTIFSAFYFEDDWFRTLTQVCLTLSLGSFIIFGFYFSHKKGYNIIKRASIIYIASLLLVVLLVSLYVIYVPNTFYIVDYDFATILGGSIIALAVVAKTYFSTHKHRKHP